MSYNGSGTFNINTAGQPVVTGTVISSTAFNALTADLGTGLSTAITKNGQTTVTANIPFNGFKLTGIGVATASGDALTYGQAATVTTLVASTSITDSGLTSGRVTYAGTAGLLQDSANLTFNGTTLTANTIGAFTLGGTVAGGGNQLNNVIIGTTTPLAGNFTTLSASSTATLSGLTASAALALDASKNIVSVTNTGSGNNVLATSPTITGATLTTSAFNGTVGATTPSTGAFTTLSATGDLTLSGTVGRVVSDANSKRVLIAGGSTATTTTGAYAIFEGYDFGGAGAGGAISLVSAAGTTNPITMAVGGTTRGVFSSTGLAVSGNVDLTAANTFPTTGMFLRAADNQLKICAGSAGIAFAAASGASTLATLDSSGNLGLGVTPSAWSALVPAFQVGGAFLAAQGTLSYSAQGTNAYYNGSNWIYRTTATASVYQQSGGVHSWQSAASGTAGNAISFTQSLAFGKGTTLALEGATSAAGTGIAFPATQSASTDANTLDDYEEGTWTPGLTCGTSGTITLTSAANSGIYTKVGRQVTAYVQMNAFSVSSPVGLLTLTGLPFNCNSTTRPSGTIILNGAAATAVTSSATMMIPGTITTYIYTRNAAGTNSTNAADIQAATDIYFSITYFV